MAADLRDVGNSGEVVFTIGCPVLCGGSDGQPVSASLRLESPSPPQRLVGAPLVSSSRMNLVLWIPQPTPQRDAPLSPRLVTAPWKLPTPGCSMCISPPTLLHCNVPATTTAILLRATLCRRAGGTATRSAGGTGISPDRTLLESWWALALMSPNHHPHPWYLLSVGRRSGNPPDGHPRGRPLARTTPKGTVPSTLDHRGGPLLLRHLGCARPW